MCVSRASLAWCDCYPQQLFGKLGAATAVSGYRAKELDPYYRRCRTVHQRVEATTPDEPRVANAKKYRRARSSPTEKGREGGPLEAKTWPLFAILAESSFRLNTCMARSWLYPRKPRDWLQIPPSFPSVRSVLFFREILQLTPRDLSVRASEFENIANNSHASNAGKLRRSSLALRVKRCYHLFLCSVAPTAPAVQPAVPPAVYRKEHL